MNDISGSLASRSDIGSAKQPCGANPVAQWQADFMLLNFMLLKMTARRSGG